MTLKELADALKLSAAEAGYAMNDESAREFVIAALVDLHEVPVIDGDCPCDLCEYVVRT